jgi:hypothetical protein
MTRRSLVRLAWAALWLGGGIFLCVANLQRDPTTQYICAVICFLMLSYNLLLVWLYWKKKPKTAEEEDAL